MPPTQLSIGAFHGATRRLGYFYRTARKRGVPRRELEPVIAGLLALQQNTVPTPADNWDAARAKAPAEATGLVGLLARLVGADRLEDHDAPAEATLLPHPAVEATAGKTTREGETQTEAGPTTQEEAAQTTPPTTKASATQTKGPAAQEEATQATALPTNNGETQTEEPTTQHAAA